MAPTLPATPTDIILYLVAILLPPVSVFYKRACGTEFWLNVLLFCLGLVPGVIHAWIIIHRYPGQTSSLPRHQIPPHIPTTYPSADAPANASASLPVEPTIEPPAYASTDPKK